MFYMNVATARPGSSFTVTTDGNIRVEETREVIGRTVKVKRVKHCPHGIIRRSEFSFEQA